MSQSVSPVTLFPPPSAETLQEVIELIRRGKNLTAHALLPDLLTAAPGWMEAKALTTAARLVDRLGDTKHSRLWHRLNFRRHPDDDVCFLHRCYDVSSSLGSLKVLRLMEQRLTRPAMEPKHRADLLAAMATFLSVFRDFDRAHAALAGALKIREDAPWLYITRASVLQRQDRREEALEESRRALALRPESGQSIDCTAALLIELNRDDEAESLLLDGCRRNEYAAIRWRLYSFYSERDRPAEALHWLDEYERHSPLIDDASRRNLAGNRATLHLLQGDPAAARAAAETCGGHYYERFAANLARPEAAAGKRIRLPVGFVRQHHMTCAPATLAALAAYWGHPAPHLEIAEKICYDGTSSYSERSWAEERGLDGREFCVTPEIASELIQRGVPFTLVTTWSTSAHLQAVIGTDSRAGLLIIRDPTSSHYSEALLEGFLKDYAAHGPRGMLVLPQAERWRVEGLVLPEAGLYDQLHRVEAALQKHDRQAAQAACDALSASAPGHRLVWQARSAFAAYDDDPVKGHEASNGMAALFPDDESCQWRAFRVNAPRCQRADNIRELERRSRDRKSDRVFSVELARLLADDFRTAGRAVRLLFRLLRRNPGDAQSLTTLAGVRWAARDFPEALHLYRLAACAADKNEACAATYFNACRQLNRAEEGLAFLRRRVESFGHLSAAPWTTLSDSLGELLRSGESLAVVREGRAKRPDDGTLILLESSLLRTSGDFDGTAALLAQARGLVPDHDWQRHAAWLAQSRGAPAEAMQHWQAVLASEPLAMDAHENLVRLTAETEGLEHALALLGRTCLQWPWHMGLARIHVRWLRREGRTTAAAELQRILQHNPADDWAWRELSLELSGRARHDEAVAAAAESLRLAPEFATSHAIYAEALHAAGRTAEAHAECRAALLLDVNAGSMHTLLATASGAAERLADLEFLRGELERQHSGGQAVAEFHTAALPLLSTEELTSVLREGNRARPDIWETWSALAEHLLNLQSPDALAVTQEMTARFPGSPGSWRLHSFACAAQGRAGERLEALQRAVSINPQWSLAVRDLAELHEREGRIDEAIAVMQRMARARPLDAANHGVLADMLLRQGLRAEAMAALERAVAVEPGYDWGWSVLTRVCREDGQPERAVAAARGLVQSRPHEPRSWIVLGETHGRLEQWDEAMTAVDRGLEQSPRNVRLHELRAQILAAAHRRPEAIAACRPPVFGDKVPRELLGREAALLMDAADYAAAGNLLENLVRSEPDYAWPRSLLYDLCRMRGENARCLELARDLVRMQPDEAVAAGMLAESLIAMQQTAEAMTAVRRAIELNPRYTYAAGRLFDDLIERRDFASAEQIAALIDRFQHGPRSLLAHCRLALAQDRLNDANRLAVEIMQTDAPDADWAATRLLEVWPDKKESRAALHQLIRAAVEQGRAKNPGLSTAYASLFSPGTLEAKFRDSIALNVPEPLRHAILRDLLYRASDTAAHDSALRIVAAHRPLLRSSTMLWGAVSYVMFQAGKYRDLIDWCADWQERKDREPWMMSNLAMALAWDCGPRGAEQAWEEVLTAGSSNVWFQAAAGLAFTSAIQGRRAEAERHLANLSSQNLTGEDKFSAVFARIALAAADAGPGTSAKNNLRASNLLNEAVRAWPSGGRSARGQHYLRELKNYIAQHRFDPAYARLPRSSNSRTMPEIPGWAISLIVIIIIGMGRTCTSGPSYSPKVTFPPPSLPQPNPPAAPPKPPFKSLDDLYPPPPRDPKDLPSSDPAELPPLKY